MEERKYKRSRKVNVVDVSLHKLMMEVGEEEQHDNVGRAEDANFESMNNVMRNGKKEEDEG